MTQQRIGVAVAAVLVAIYVWTVEPHRGPAEPDVGTDIQAVFDQGRSGVMVEAAGEVVRLLSDDTHGVPHQRFVVALADGHTVLISHNIDLAPRAPVRPGDRLAFRGQYEWDDRGGVVHWTHRDPGGKRQGGWLEHRGRRYR